MSRDLIIGAVLLGGKSKRMGEPKHLIRLDDGRTMLDHVSRLLKPYCEEIVLLGNTMSDVPSDFRLIEDRRAGTGPLAGIESLLLSELCSRYLIVACDQPLLTSRLLEQILNSSAPICVFGSALTGHLYPFPGVYDTSILSTVQRSLDEERRSVQGVFRAVNAETILIDQDNEAMLQSANTPEELERLLQRQAP